MKASLAKLGLTEERKEEAEEDATVSRVFQTRWNGSSIEAEEDDDAVSARSSRRSNPDINAAAGNSDSFCTCVSYRFLSLLDDCSNTKLSGTATYSSRDQRARTRSSLISCVNDRESMDDGRDERDKLSIRRLVLRLSDSDWQKLFSFRPLEPNGLGRAGLEWRRDDARARKFRARLEDIALLMIFRPCNYSGRRVGLSTLWQLLAESTEQE